MNVWTINFSGETETCLVSVFHVECNYLKCGINKGFQDDSKIEKKQWFTKIDSDKFEKNNIGFNLEKT